MNKQPRVCVEPYIYGGYLVTLPDDSTAYVQSDWDFPRLAVTFGGRIHTRGCPSRCRGTDGTVACPDCGTTVGDYISRAMDYLDGCPSVSAREYGDDL